MSICVICGSVDTTKPSNWDRDCTACLIDDIKNSDGTFTPTEKIREYIKRKKA